MAVISPAKTTLISWVALCLASTALAGGDTIVLKDGKKLHGEILFTAETDYVISVEGKPRKVPLSDIQKIEFGPG